MKTGKCPPDMREDGGNPCGGGETEVMLDGFRVRNGFRERLVTKLKEREYPGRKAGGPACLGGGRDVRGCGWKASAERQHGNVDFRREGRKRLGAGGRVSWGGGVYGVWTQKGRVQCIQTLPVVSRRIGGGPFTSWRNEPWRTHPELEFTL